MTMPDVIEMEGRFLFNRGGDMFFVSKTIDDRLPQKVREHVARWLPNQAVTWRHQSPRKPEYVHQPVYGRILAAKAYSSGIASIVQLYGDSVVPTFYAKRQALQKLVKRSTEMQRDIGLSLVFDNIKINQVSAEAEPFEVGVTPRPDCITCTLKYGVKKMVGEAEKHDPAPAVDKATKDKIDEALESATIDELQTLLESKVTELEKEKADKTETVGKFKSELENKEKRIAELEKGLNEQKDSFGKLMKELEGAKRAPFIDALKAEDKKALYSDKVIASLEIKEIEEVTKKLKEMNSVATKIAVTSLEASAVKAQSTETPAPPKVVKIEELEDEKELAKQMDIDTPYGKSLVKKIREKKAVKK